MWHLQGQKKDYMFSIDIQVRAIWDLFFINVCLTHFHKIKRMNLWNTFRELNWINMTTHRIKQAMKQYFTLLKK